MQQRVRFTAGVAALAATVSFLCSHAFWVRSLFGL